MQDGKEEEEKQRDIKSNRCAIGRGKKADKRKYVGGTCVYRCVDREDIQ
jgi:hypothetical protein